MVKLIACLAAASVICVALIGAMTGAYQVTSGQAAGRAIGAALTAFVIGLVIALATRMVAGRSARDGNAGMLAGLAGVAIFSLFLFVGAST